MNHLLEYMLGAFTFGLIAGYLICLLHNGRKF